MKMGWLMLVLLAGCATQAPLTEPAAPMSVALQVATHQGAGLNVGILAFTFDSPEDRSLGEVRSLEARYMPYLLRETLVRSGQWGAVSVVPREDADVELMIRGHILESSGQRLVVHITATDTSGTPWLDREYRDFTNDLDYAADPTYQLDPFQDLYNQVSNDLSEKLAEPGLHDQERLLQISLMKFARRLSPETFGNYLNEVDSRTMIERLPASNDPIMVRINRLRESEYLFTDSVDAHFGELFTRLGQTYAWWRYYNYELTVGNERLKEKDARRGATRGSWYAMERIYKTYKESRMNEDALLELTRSFDRETSPIVAEVSGRVVELDGTLDQQIDLWRLILGDMYREEVETNHPQSVVSPSSERPDQP